VLIAPAGSMARLAGDGAACCCGPAIEVEFGGVACLRIPPSTPPELAAAVVRALRRRSRSRRTYGCGSSPGSPTFGACMTSLALQVQEGLKRDPHAGDLYVFRGKSGHLIKVLWHAGIGMSLYAKRLERGRFVGLRPEAPKI
jgi:hypothetical protein